MDKVKLSSRVLQQLEQLGEQHSHEECCALLIGDGEEILEVIPIENTHPYKQSRYQPHPEEFFKQLQQTSYIDKTSGRHFMGIFHNHPFHEAKPSTVDIEGTGYAGWYPIYSNRDKQINFYLVTYPGAEWQHREYYLLEPAELAAG